MQLEGHLSASRVLSVAHCMKDRNEVGGNLMWGQISLSLHACTSFIRKKKTVANECSMHSVSERNRFEAGKSHIN